jgi:hypothetical protein
MNISEVKRLAAAYDSWVSTHSNYNLIKDSSQGQNIDFAISEIVTAASRGMLCPPPHISASGSGVAALENKVQRKREKK